jgi:phage host-nuclease inhibitor protein Gam
MVVLYLQQLTYQHNLVGLQGRTGGTHATIKQEANMALTEATLQDKIEIVGDYKHVQVRTATVISRDGVEISRSFSRHVVAPDADVSGESAEVQAICAVVHTDEVKAAYAAMLEAQGV